MDSEDLSDLLISVTSPALIHSPNELMIEWNKLLIWVQSALARDSCSVRDYVHEDVDVLAHVHAAVVAVAGVKEGNQGIGIWDRKGMMK